MGLFSKKPKEKESEIWEDFGVTEKEWDNWWKEVEHAEIDSETCIEFARNLFPSSKHDQAKAFIFMHMGRHTERNKK